VRLRLASVGRERADPSAPLVADYLARIERFVPIESVVYKPERGDRIAARFLKERGPGKLLVALDERGEQLTSRGLSALISSWMDGGVNRVTFAVGGADGLPAALRDEADLLLSLSRLTLPHRLARLVLVEQLYRALCIIRHVPYDRAGAGRCG
jgi:23S rRNA (pseudouridine1915-N3)-methyltransferase